MLINDDSDEFVTIVKHNICKYHKKHPQRKWAGCTCSSLIYRGKRKDAPEPLDQEDKTHPLIPVH